MSSVVPWHPEAGEDKREFLQARCVAYTRVALVTFTALALLLSAFQLLFPEELMPERSELLVLFGIAGVPPLAGFYLFVRTRERTIAALYASDAALALFLGSYLGGAAFLIPDHAPNVYLPFIFMTLCVFTRVLVVPSKATRTVVVATLTALPLVVGYAALALLESQYLDIPPAVFLIGAISLSAAVVVLAWVGSAVMYGLRRDVSRLGQYRLEDKLGEGAMGEVYRASHALLRRPTAIKLLKVDGANKRILERFEREVQLTSQLTHPNTISIYDYGTTPDGRFYYVMEYLEGVDLDRLVAERGALPANRVIHLLEQICSALAEAHDRDLIHRDIKPANLMVCRRGDRRDVIKIVDFGLAKDLQDNSNLTGQLVAGTPAYLAPEMIIDPKAVSTASDLYALGATAYFLATGQLVFEGKTIAEICLHHVKTEPPPVGTRTPSPIPPALEQLIMQCLDKDPANRPASARAMAQALRRMAAEYPWTEEDAIAWWNDDAGGAKLGTAQASGSFAPVTMTIDIERRDSAG